MAEDEDENDLDEYYRELGIDPEEMKPQRSVSKKATETPQYTTRDKKVAPEQTIQRQRSELLKKMMERARSSPNYKILNRII
jgi:hypothetical protein